MKVSEFVCLENALNGKTFTTDEDIKSFFAEKHKNLFERGIIKLSKRWQKVIEQNE